MFDAWVMADALAAVVADADVDEAVLLGFSFGGVVVQIFAKRHPERVAALVAYACYAPYSQAAPLPRWMISPLVMAHVWTTRLGRFASAFRQALRRKGPVSRAH